MRPRILVLDEDPQVLALLKMILKSKGASVVGEHDATHGLDLLKTEPIDVLFTNLRMQGRDELEVLRAARKIQPNLPVVVITAVGSVESTINAFRLGAADYLTKPFRSEQVSAALARAIAKSTQTYHPASRDTPHCNGIARHVPVTIIATSPSMRHLAEKCSRLASSSLPILVVGDVGVGKKRIVRLIHSLSARRETPYVQVNCDAMQESQLVEKFFGKEGAADRGEVPTPCGLIEQAADGMLVLGNVTGLPRWMQKELLQAAQAGVFHRSGGSEPISFRARVAASTSRVPADSVKKGVLLNDLHCYFGVTPLNVPPLRDRREDIRPLVDALMRDACCELLTPDQLPTRRFTEEALLLLEAYGWPGNIHELGNFIRRVVVFVAESEITAAHVTELLPSPPTLRDTNTITVPFVGDLKLIERAIVAEVISRAHGNKSAAARSLGLHRKTLYRIIENDTNGRAKCNSG